MSSLCFPYSAIDIALPLYIFPRSRAPRGINKWLAARTAPVARAGDFIPIPHHVQISPLYSYRNFFSFRLFSRDTNASVSSQ